jgi:hypothetical protein
MALAASGPDGDEFDRRTWRWHLRSERGALVELIE